MSLSCDLGYLEFYNEQEQVARKEHACEECSAPIVPGERYLYGAGKFDGEFFVIRQHLLCRDSCVWIRDVLNGDEGCIPFGSLHEWWSELGKSASDSMPWDERRKLPPEQVPAFERRWERNWLIGARMYAMVCRRERLVGRADTETGGAGRPRDSGDGT